MSDGRLQVLPFPLVGIGASPRQAFKFGKVSLWPDQAAAKAVLRQNAALRAQNAALKRALDDRSGPLPGIGSPSKDRDMSADLHFLPTARTIPDLASQIRQCLTHRQRQVLDRVLAGCPSKNIAADLGISQRTVENHRAAIMRRTGATSIPALARIVVGAAQGGDCKAARTRHSPPE